MNTRQMADKVQSKGRHGDSILVHMHPAEVAGIASLTPGGLTINPRHREAGGVRIPAAHACRMGRWGGSVRHGIRRSGRGYRCWTWVSGWHQNHRR
jgi:hypothetical protein